MAQETATGIASVFGHLVGSDEKILEQCLSLCQTYNLGAEDLKFKWEASNFKSSSTRSEISPFTLDSLLALREQMRCDVTRDSAKKPQKRMVTTTNTAMVNRSRIPANMLKNVNPAISSVGNAQVKSEPGYGLAGPSTGRSAVVFKGPAMDALSRKTRSYRYMYEKISERSEALDDRIDEFGELIREHYNISELGDPSSSTDEEITVIGRITHDSESSAASAKLTETSLALESSRMHASGARVPLRFDPGLLIRGGAQGSGGTGIFPGAIVALKGKNGGGGWFLVTEILSLPPLKPSPAALGLTGTKSDPGSIDTPFSMFIVSGPYTQDTDLSYKPWKRLVETIKAAKPTVVLLIGPFIDVQHPILKTGEVDATPASLFRSRFIDPLRMFLDSSPGSIALIVPSVRDLISRQAVFPQGELGAELTNADPRIHLLPNPVRFSINDISFAVSSVDAVYHLRKEEFMKRGREIDSIPPSSTDDTGTDSMANTCRCLLEQRSFYPLFPVPLDVSHEVNLSVTHLDHLKLGDEKDNCAPDILIVPSRLKQFNKVVHSTMATNPSFLIKGTYATLNVTPRGTLSLRERLTMNIVKLES
ncbi:DNA polymerase alpha subunit B [Hypsizygus marmoreus]|uniref:DNA polymerase alpha subunit B n=1 Tax=Hypsizygus marmoreus TaxID=39966 RepID=A0A369J9P0_HYPMA|nr:DNA polymerase alpha subunit B [Hypsizygus marmoreus]